MKRRILIIFDYERITPPFLQSIINEAQNTFDNIYYITPPIPDYYIKLITHPRLQIITWNRFQRLMQYVKGCLSILRPTLWRELSKGAFSIGAIKSLGICYFSSNGQIDISRKFIKQALNNNDEVYTLATWFSTDAFSCARLKKNYPNIKAYSLAHSFEVIPERNTYLHQSFNEFKHKYLDNTYFISNKVLQLYYSGMDKFAIKERFGSRISVQYLGSIKDNSHTNPASPSKTFHIVTCSRIDANKRLSNIIQALKGWCNGKLHWTHIGEGILENQVKAEAKSLQQANPNIQIDFTGRLDNPDVKRFYETIHVDLFVNTSWSEGLPISIMEAMSYGIPALATDVGGTSEIVNESNGRLLPQKFTETDFLSRLEELQGLSAEKMIQMRNNAFLTWQNKFNARENAKRMFNEWFAK